MATLGGGETTSGDEESAKVSRHGTTGNGRGDRCAPWMAEAGDRGGDLSGAGEKCVRVPREWPPLEVPGRAPLEGLGLGCGTDCWEAGSGGAMIQRDLVDW